MKKILIVDDSALMRSVICAIINTDDRFKVEDQATNGLEALELLRSKQYDAVILDINMPIMDGLELLKQLQIERIKAKVLIVSSDSKSGAKVTMDALELGALDFIQKPGQAESCRKNCFTENLLQLLFAVSNGKTTNLKAISDSGRERPSKIGKSTKKISKELGTKEETLSCGKKIIAVASSTGGPRALQCMISEIPKEIDAPIVIVQHMPKSFTQSFAERLNRLCSIPVTEAKEGENLKVGHAYLSMGGKHLNVVQVGEKHTIHYSDEPTREGVKPCANYMYESLKESGYDEIICVVLTGMGSDGTQGIKNLKMCKKTYVIAQSEESCAVYGMPKSIVNAKLSDKVLPLEEIAREIIVNTGVKKDGCKPIS